MGLISRVSSRTYRKTSVKIKKLKKKMNDWNHQVDQPKKTALDADGSPAFVGIKFCQECNNMLYPKEDKKHLKLIYRCRICGFEQLADNPCTFVNKIVHEVDELKHIIPDLGEDPTLPKNNDKECPNCSGMRCVYFQSHSTKAEQGMRLYFVCCTCGHKWTDEDQ